MLRFEMHESQNTTSGPSSTEMLKKYIYDKAIHSPHQAKPDDPKWPEMYR